MSILHTDTYDTIKRSYATISMLGGQEGPGYRGGPGGGGGGRAGCRTALAVRGCCALGTIHQLPQPTCPDLCSPSSYKWPKCRCANRGKYGMRHAQVQGDAVGGGPPHLHVPFGKAQSP